jgi:hypothetical protein
MWDPAAPAEYAHAHSPLMPARSWPSASALPQQPPSISARSRSAGEVSAASGDLPCQRSALVTLLLPHSDMPLRQIITLVTGQLKRHAAGYQMGKLTAGPAALRILTELSFALDAHDIPINYHRRRDLAVSTTPDRRHHLDHDRPRRRDAGSPANTASPSASAAARYSSPPARHPAATRATCPNHSVTPSPGATHGHASAACS